MKGRVVCRVRRQVKQSQVAGLEAAIESTYLSLPSAAAGDAEENVSAGSGRLQLSELFETSGKHSAAAASLCLVVPSPANQIWMHPHSNSAGNPKAAPTIPLEDAHHLQQVALQDAEGGLQLHGFVQGRAGEVAGKQLQGPCARRFPRVKTAAGDLSGSERERRVAPQAG